MNAPMTNMIISVMMREKGILFFDDVKTLGRLRRCEFMVEEEEAKKES